MNGKQNTRKNCDWQTLVGDIAELEELIAEIHTSHDAQAHTSLHALKRTLSHKRQQLKALDVGLIFQQDRKTRASAIS